MRKADIAEEIQKQSRLANIKMADVLECMLGLLKLSWREAKTFPSVVWHAHGEE